MTRVAAIVLGHSHMMSVLRFLADRPASPVVRGRFVEYYVFDTTRGGVDFPFSVPDGAGNYVLNPSIAEMIASKVPADRELIYISMFGGNAHNALTLLEHPRPFDFILPERPDLPRVPGAELVPYSYVVSFIHKLARGYILNMVCARNATTNAVLHIELPPPVGEDSFVLEHLEGYFREQSENPKIAPAILRYKLWRAHSELIRAACAACNVEYLSAPNGTMTAEGFLVTDGYSEDSTHAGKWYGGRVLNDVEDRLGADYGGWAWLY